MNDIIIVAAIAYLAGGGMAAGILIFHYSAMLRSYADKIESLHKTLAESEKMLDYYLVMSEKYENKEG